MTVECGGGERECPTRVSYNTLRNRESGNHVLDHEQRSTSRHSLTRKGMAVVNGPGNAEERVTVVYAIGPVRDAADGYLSTSCGLRRRQRQEVIESYVYHRLSVLISVRFYHAIHFFTGLAASVVGVDGGILRCATVNAPNEANTGAATVPP